MRVAHGIFSYTNVLLFLRSLKNKNILENDAEIENIKKYINKRIKAIEYRIFKGINNIEKILSKNELTVWKKIFKEIVVNNKKINSNISEEITFNNNAFNRTNIINDIEKAEILLSMHGYKVSRLTININNVKSFKNIINDSISYCFSNQLFTSNNSVFKFSLI